MSIYIILSQTNTKIGKLLRFFTGFQYNHVSICLDQKYEKLYSFGRYFYHLPFVGGFITEDMYSMFSERNSLKVRMIEIPLDDKTYGALANTLQNMESDSEKYIYDLASILLCPPHLHVPIYKAFNCSQFVAKMLEDHHIMELDMPYYNYTPKDLDQLLCSFASWDETLHRENYHVQNPYFFAKFNTFFATKVTFTFVYKVLQRIVLYEKNSQKLSYDIQPITTKIARKSA